MLIIQHSFQGAIIPMKRKWKSAQRSTAPQRPAAYLGSAHVISEEFPQISTAHMVLLPGITG